MSTDTLPSESPSPPASDDVASRYRLAVIGAARSGDVEIDPGLLREAGRFDLDFATDVGLMRNRFDDARRIREANAELAKLERDPPRRAKASDMLADYVTVGDLMVAMDQVRNPAAYTAAEIEHQRRTNEAMLSKRRAENRMRRTSSKSLQAEIGDLHNAIARRREAVVEHEKSQKRAADLEKAVGKRPVRDDEQAEWFQKREELTRLRARLQDTPAPSAGDSDLRHQLETLAAKQLDPIEGAEFLPPRPAEPATAWGIKG